MENARLLEARSASARPNCASPSTTWATASRCSTPSCGSRHGTAISSRCSICPTTFLAQRPSFADYIRYLAAHGEYGAVEVEAEMRRSVEDAGRNCALERTRPDGRVIEVRRNAVPGGGFVLIYSDITERKRSEAEIRAARDAAETALRDLRRRRPT